MQGPCSPRTKDTLPAATETLSPVATYTDDRAAGGCTSAQSGLSTPRNTPQSPPMSVSRRYWTPCKAVYPDSSRMRCCGSIAAASAGEMPNATLSKYCASPMKPPCSRDAACDALSELVSSGLKVYRDEGTLPTASPQASCSARLSLHPPGQRPTKLLSVSTMSAAPRATHKGVLGTATAGPSTFATSPSCSSR
eukprot:1534178-Prymnesium_polylepis.1